MFNKTIILPRIVYLKQLYNLSLRKEKKGRIIEKKN